MTRKSASRTHTPVRAEPTHVKARERIRLPQSWRKVTARKLGNVPSNRAQPARREVPEIRLSGAWLERIGFVKGRRYLISVDREIETIYLSAEILEPPSRKRR